MALVLIADSFQTSPNPFIALMLGGFAIGIFGYLYGSRAIVAVGVGMIFLATMVIPLVLSLSS